jgi:hypothetical protein
MIRVVLPYHLRNLAGVDGEIRIETGSDSTLGKVLDALEAQHPVLRGTLRDRNTLRRRPFIRFFACREDFSHSPLETILPHPVSSGDEPLFIIGAMAGG